MGLCSNCPLETVRWIQVGRVVFLESVGAGTGTGEKLKGRQATGGQSPWLCGRELAWPREDFGCLQGERRETGSLGKEAPCWASPAL